MKGRMILPTKMFGFQLKRRAHRNDGFYFYLMPHHCYCTLISYLTFCLLISHYSSLLASHCGRTKNNKKIKHHINMDMILSIITPKHIPKGFIGWSTINKYGLCFTFNLLHDTPPSPESEQSDILQNN